MVLRLPFLDRSEFENVGFEQRGKPEYGTRRKTSRSKGENQQQTQPSSGICTWTTLVRGARSHYCAIGATVALPRSICTVRESPGDLPVVSIQSRFLSSHLDTNGSRFQLLRRGCCVALYNGFFLILKKGDKPETFVFFKKHLTQFDISLLNITSSAIKVVSIQTSQAVKLQLFLD